MFSSCSAKRRASDKYLPLSPTTKVTLLHLGTYCTWATQKKDAFLKQNQLKVGLSFKRVDIFHKLHNMPVPVPTISSCIREIHTDYNLQTIKEYL